MVEAMTNSVEYYLIDGLSFKLSPGASYVTNRRNVTWYTSGGVSNKFLDRVPVLFVFR